MNHVHILNASEYLYNEWETEPVHTVTECVRNLHRFVLKYDSKTLILVQGDHTAKTIVGELTVDQM
jgi:hypothetical protein